LGHAPSTPTTPRRKCLIIRRQIVAANEWTIGVGGGAYVALSKNSDPATGESDPQSVCGVVSATAARRLSPNWSARFTWNRIITHDDRDTDMLLLGLGYRLSEPRQ
jgi:hypothetical protein